MVCIYVFRRIATRMDDEAVNEGHYSALKLQIVHHPDHHNNTVMVLRYSGECYLKIETETEFYANNFRLHYGCFGSQLRPEIAPSKASSFVICKTNEIHSCQPIYN